MPVAKKSPLNLGKKYYIRKSFKEWSSTTQVVLLEVNKTGLDVLVEHEATKKVFWIPVEYLIKKRNRA